ncbi:MAG: transcription termination factor Rho, partial [Streptomyces sp.]|nr:transcription termination factor Rho [Streptomyces sp.]
MADHRPGTVHTARTEAGSTTGRRARQADVRSREGPFVSDTTDLMGARVEETAAAPATDASAPATGAGSRRRRGTGLDGMVLAELQQVASGLGIRGTARMRKSQLIEVIKEAQAGGGAASAKAASSPAGDAVETKPKRRATSKARTGEDAAPAAEKKAAAPAEKAVAQQQIEIPGQPASEDAAPAERRRRRATAEAGSPETVAAEAKSEPKAETPAPQPQGDAGDGEGRQGRRD